jgi:LysM repeat protein
MMKLFRVFLIVALLLIVSSTYAQEDSDNLLENPSFELPYVEQGGNPIRQVAQGWVAWHSERQPDQPSWRNRQPEYQPATVEDGFVNSGDYAQVIFNNTWWTHEAGLYQTVAVEAEQEFTFSVYAHVWSSKFEDRTISQEGSVVSVQVGIDPTGGTDVTSDRIIWSTTDEQYDSFVEHTVTAVAESDTITVWIKSFVYDPVQNSFVYVDDASLFATSTEEVTVELTEEAIVDEEPVEELTAEPTEEVTVEPTEEAIVDEEPVEELTAEPTEEVTVEPTEEAIVDEEPVEELTAEPTEEVTVEPTEEAIVDEEPVEELTAEPTEEVTVEPTITPTATLAPTNTSIPATELPLVTPTPVFTNTPLPPTATPTPLTLTEEEKALTNEVVHVVSRGETVGRIAANYGSTVNAIRFANDLNPDNLIFIGQELIIPISPDAELPTETPIPTSTASATVAPPTLIPVEPTPTLEPVLTDEPEDESVEDIDIEEEIYYVRYGDTLAKIAWRYNTTVLELAQRNAIVNVNRIYVGQALVIPVPVTEEEPKVTETPEPIVTPEPEEAVEVRYYTVQYGDSLYRISGVFNVSIDAIAEANNITNYNLIYRGQILIIP